MMSFIYFQYFMLILNKIIMMITLNLIVYGSNARKLYKSPRF